MSGTAVAGADRSDARGVIFRGSSTKASAALLASCEIVATASRRSSTSLNPFDHSNGSVSLMCSANTVTR
jgi:hypothetical protein